MSDFRAIGGVSATLRALLADRMELPELIQDVPVTIGPPPFSSKDNEPRLESPRLNLFLYRVTENGFLQNQEIPGRGGNGYGHPPLSLNLHYLVTAYGNHERKQGSAVFDETEAHFLLGSAMRVLHDFPIVTDELLSVRPPSGGMLLHSSLRDAYERVRLSLEPLTLEDVTKVWTALALRYRLSAAYVVNVVQVESRRARTFPRPVGQPTNPKSPPLPSDPPTPGPWIYALTLQTPTITEVRVKRVGETEEQPFPYARIGDTLVLRGTSLSGIETLVRFGDVEVATGQAHPDRVEAVVPDATAGTTAIPERLRLQPGVRSVQVVTRDPKVPHSRFSSNEAAFVVVPSVTSAGVILAAGPPRTLTIEGSRLAGTGLAGQTVIGRAVVPQDEFLSTAPDRIVLPVPTTLPAQGVHVLVGAALPDPVSIGNTGHELRVDIAGDVRTATAATLPPALARAEVQAILTSMIRDAKPADPRFARARVEFWHNRLVVVAGDLFSPVSITSPGLTFAADLGLAAAQDPGNAHAAVSGDLSLLAPLTSPNPRVDVRVGAQAPVSVELAHPTSVAGLAADLHLKIRGASVDPAYAAARVLSLGQQIMVIPGAAGAVAFEAPASDATTVAELQLHARFGVRVRVNGAESIDPATVELP